ncbi:MAG: VOC family protein [Acidimicrobiia bacterium]
MCREESERGSAKIFPCLWFERDAKEATAFDTGLLPGSRIDNVWRSAADTPCRPAGTGPARETTISKPESQNGNPSRRQPLGIRSRSVIDQRLENHPPTCRSGTQCLDEAAFQFRQP